MKIIIITTIIAITYMTFMCKACSTTSFLYIKMLTPQNNPISPIYRQMKKLRHRIWLSN